VVLEIGSGKGRFLISGATEQLRKVEADESGLARIDDKTGVIHAGIIRKARS